MFGTVVPLVIAFVLVCANGIFVAVEFSMVAVDRDQMERAAAGGDRRARSVARALRTLSFQLSGAQLGITLCSLLVGYLVEPAVRELLGPSLATIPGLGVSVATVLAGVIAILVSTGALIVLGELVPQNAAIAHPDGTAKLVAVVQRGFSAALRPLIAALNSAANRIVRVLGVEPAEELENIRSADELSMLMSGAARAGTVGASTAEMARRSLRFGEQRAGEVMTPRVDVISAGEGTTVSQLLVLARDTGLSRFPVCGRGLDDVTGMASVKGALRVPAGQRDSTRVTEVSREPLRVPESVTADAVLSQLRAADTQLAVVVDEYGGTAGIVTLEDLAEELVGQIADEYDLPEARSDGTRVWAAGRIADVSGTARLDELAESLGIELPEGPYDTLAGFLLDRFGRLPTAGETLDYRQWRFGVLGRTRQRIRRVRIEWLSGEETDTGAIE